jgi:hypothetical protein
MTHFPRWLALAAAMAAALVAGVPTADARSGHSTGSQSNSYRVTTPRAQAPRTKTPSYVQRDSNGRIKRSLEAKHEFKNEHPCPATGKSYGSCPGYVIDHVTALKRGGADAPSNMQWQTIEEAKLKDKIE